MPNLIRFFPVLLILPVVAACGTQPAAVAQPAPSASSDEAWPASSGKLADQMGSAEPTASADASAPTPSASASTAPAGAKTGPKGKKPPPKSVATLRNLVFKGQTPSNGDFVINSMTPDFVKCHQQGTKEDPNMQGSIGLKIKIKKGGALDEVAVLTQRGVSESVVKCVTDRAKAAEFLKIDKPAIVSFVVELSLDPPPAP